MPGPWWTRSCTRSWARSCSGLSFYVIEKVLPFSMRKEIAEDQNMALGIILGAFVIGLSIIIAAAISSDPVAR